MLKYLVLILIIIILSYLLKKNERFLSPDTSDTSDTSNTSNLSPSEYLVKKIEIEENIKEYNKSRKYFDNINEKYNFKIGYDKLNSTNPNSIGFCYPGKYLKSDKKNNFGPNNLNDCEDCTKCNNGYYLKEGCSGDSNSVCEVGKVPYDIYIEGHQPKTILHNVINPHTHIISDSPSETLTDTNHYHI